MEEVTQVLSILTYAFGIILLIALIILVIRSIQTLNKVDKIIDDVDNKIKSLDGFFVTLDKANNIIYRISDQIISAITNFIVNIFEKKKEK